MGIFSFFSGNKVKLLESEIVRLEKELEERTADLDYANQKIEKLQLELKDAIPKKQADIVNKNLNSNKTYLDKYKTYSKAYNINIDKALNTYKVNIATIYPKSKFSDLLNKFAEDKIETIQDIVEFDLEEFASIKNADLAYEIFKNFHKNIMSWDVRTALHKGEKLSTVFKKNVKLVKYFNSLNFEYFDDIIDYDFSKLREQDFKEKDINIFEQIKKEYIEKSKI